jgi:hypothetical protein
MNSLVEYKTSCWTWSCTIKVTEYDYDCLKQWTVYLCYKIVADVRPCHMCLKQRGSVNTCPHGEFVSVTVDLWELLCNTGDWTVGAVTEVTGGHVSVTEEKWGFVSLTEEKEEHICVTEEKDDHVSVAGEKGKLVCVVEGKGDHVRIIIQTRKYDTLPFFWTLSIVKLRKHDVSEAGCASFFRQRRT